MPSRSTTATKILEASRRRFNESGYTGTTIAEIAASAGIAPGNLTYHFPTKHDLVVALREDATERMEARRRRRTEGDLIHRYMVRLADVYAVAADYRFLLRDRNQLDDADETTTPPMSMVADYADLRALLDQLDEAGHVRRDMDVDLDQVTRTLWILGRHWPDHLREMHQRSELTDADHRNGMEHHLSILLPNLTADARRRFRNALHAVTGAT